MPILSTHPNSTKIGENLGTGPCILEPLYGAGATTWIPMPISAPPAPFAPDTPQAESDQLWEVLFFFSSKISSGLKNHSLAPAPLMPRKTVDVRSLLRYLEENSSFCSLPSLYEVTESDDKANSDLCWDLFPH